MANLDLRGEDPEECLKKETDITVRKVRISIYTMPLQNVLGSALPDRTPFKHWGIWAEFEATDVQHGPCVYTIDADVMPYGNGNPSSPVTLLMTLMAGNFVVKVGKFHPHLVKHPYQKYLKKEPEEIFEMSPYDLVEVTTFCTTEAFKVYNVVLNNCQTFAKHLLEQIRESLKNASLTPRRMWTTENIAIAIAAFVTGVLATAAVWGVMQLDGGRAEGEEVNIANEEDQATFCQVCHLYHLTSPNV